MERKSYKISLIILNLGILYCCIGCNYCNRRYDAQNGNYRIIQINMADTNDCYRQLYAERDFHSQIVKLKSNSYYNFPDEEMSMIDYKNNFNRCDGAEYDETFDLDNLDNLPEGLGEDAIDIIKKYYKHSHHIRLRHTLWVDQTIDMWYYKQRDSMIPIWGTVTAGWLIYAE